MPRGDRTGPSGMGPMTGRAAGFCAGYPSPGYTNPQQGGGFGGMGRGRGGGGGGGGGRGWQNRFNATAQQQSAMPVPPASVPGGYAAPVESAVARQQEMDMLKGQFEYFHGALEEIKERIQQIEANASQKAEK